MVREASPLEAAAAALARRDRSAAWLTRFLEGRGVSADEAAGAVARLERAGYVDDVRFAAARADSLAARGSGDEAIRADLTAAGVADEDVVRALAALEPEAERARMLVERLGTSARTARRLVAKGFDADAVEAAFAASRDAPDG